MVGQRTVRALALATGVAAVAAPGAVAQASVAGPEAHVAGGGAAALDPPIVGIPIARTDRALGTAADAIDAGRDALAVAPLTASRNYLNRSFKGGRYLIDNAPPTPPATDSSVRARTFVRRARSAIGAVRDGTSGHSGWIRARTSGTGAGGPAFADAPTAVFDVFTSQFDAATASVGLLPDVRGDVLTAVNGTLGTAMTLRDRLVRVVHAAAPATPPPATDSSLHARVSGAPVGGTGFDAVMPGLTVLLDAELQQMQATARDTDVPAASRAALARPIAANRRLARLVNQWWPPAPADD